MKKEELIKNIAGVVIILLVTCYGFLNIHNDVEKVKKIQKDYKENLNNPTEQVDFAPWMQELDKKIKQNWNPPNGKDSKVIVLKFIVGKNGDVLKFIVKDSIMDEANMPSVLAAVEAVKKSSPFNPLPEGFSKDQITIQYTFDYSIIYGE